MTSKRTIMLTALCLLGLLGSMLMMTAGLAAQNQPQIHPAKPTANHAAIENNPSCQRIIQECQKLGFIVGQWKKDNGLWKDCFDPVVKGGTPSRDGKPIQVPVSSSDIQACRAAAHPR
jgi:hypothetical protein